MTTALYRHKLCLLHDAGPGHPESPSRLQAIEKQLETDKLLEQVLLLEPPVAQREDLVAIHDPAYVEKIFSTAPSSGLVHLDGDTAMNPHSLQSALLAAGAVIDATERVLSGRLDNAFCCARPPGHHAEYGRAMGFCLFGNVAAGAAYALQRHQLDRVAIVDFDVHHGNGTEDIFRDESRVLFCSSFQHPFYPYTDISNPGDNVVYSPLPTGSGSSEFRTAIERDWLPALRRQQPQMIFVSAGFDAHRDDPLGGLLLDDDDFSWVTRQLAALAGELCNGRMVSTLEGGYDTAALGRCVSRHVSELLAAGQA
ncbi:MAG: histone deacetylase family protein [Gammaproteobacteria bacterium]|nr:histone deacetylase family protein [Gammaproteobacteria bacterium]NNF61374.1 histone deacetylase family protein [Gammaproteobacteria bacterium]